MANKSRAVSSQGTKFYIEKLGEVGTVTTVTGITKAAAAVCTAAAHTRVVGDVVAFAAVVGMTEINGLTGVVTAIAAGTFTVNIDSTGFTAYASGGTATPKVFLEIQQHKTYNFDDPGAAERDITTLVSEEKEFGLGLADPGNFTCDLHYVEDDAAQIEMQTARSDSAARYFRIHKRNKYIKVFNGLVKALTDTGAIDGSNAGSLSVRISGPKVEVLGA